MKIFGVIFKHKVICMRHVHRLQDSLVEREEKNQGLGGFEEGRGYYEATYLFHVKYNPISRMSLARVGYATDRL